MMERQTKLYYPVRRGELDAGESWLSEHSNWLALGAIAAAFALRLYYSSACYLNPDEAIHFDVVRQSSWSATYDAAFKTPEPPLFFLVLHAMLSLGRSELVLRLPSILAGIAALWLAFAWMRRVFGELPALCGLLFLCFSPAAISAATEVREYSLLLFFICGALYATERAFNEQSANWAIAQGVCLAGALLTHYTAVIPIASIGLLTVARWKLDNVPKSVVVVFCSSAVLLAALLAWLYFCHVRLYVPFGFGGNMAYLKHYYYQKDYETPVGYTLRSLLGTSEYLAGSNLLAVLLFLAFLSGTGALFLRPIQEGPAIGLLIISTFIVGFAAAIFQIFPFTGTRHQAYLLPYFAAGIAAAIAQLQDHRLAATVSTRRLAIAISTLALCAAFSTLAIAPPDNDPRAMRKGDMATAINYLRANVPSGSVLFVDERTRFALGYYLSRDEKEVDVALLSNVIATSRADGGVEVRLGGYRVVEPQKYMWAFTPSQAVRDATESARAARISPGEPFWIVSQAWMEPSLASRLPKADKRDAKEFGRISVIKVSAGGK